MNDHDWLDEELQNLPDLKAPNNLLPEIMNRVQERAAQPIWIRFWREHWTLVRNLSLGLSMALLILLFWLNPARVFQTPLWLVILAVTAASYSICIVAASTVQRLAATKS